MFSYSLCPFYLPAGHFYSSPPDLFRPSPQSTFRFRALHPYALLCCEIAGGVSAPPSASGIFLIERLPTMHHFQKKKKNLFVSNFSCTEGTQYFRDFSPAWLTEYYNLGQIFMQRKLTLVALVTNSLYCQKTLSYISVLPWKTSFCPLDDLSLVRTTYLSYQITYWFNEMNRANEIAHCIISVTN